MQDWMTGAPGAHGVQVARVACQHGVRRRPRERSRVVERVGRAPLQRSGARVAAALVGRRQPVRLDVALNERDNLGNVGHDASGTAPGREERRQARARADLDEAPA